MQLPTLFALNALLFPLLSSAQSPPNTPLINLHRSLCTIDSSSGKEGAVTTWLSDYLKSNNWTVQLQQVAANRNNLYAYLGSDPKADILVTSHLDTVPPYINWTYHDDGTITGRGTNDAKGSVAAQIIAVHDMIAAGELKAGDVSLLYVVGEETGGEGMIKVNELNYTWKTGIFGEPTENKLSKGHKGILRANLEAFGKAAHSAYPELGIDANGNLIDAIQYLRYETKWPTSSLFGNTTVNFGVLMGGQTPNVISPYANASVSIRLVDTVDTTKGVFDKAVAQFSNKGVNKTYFGTFYDPVTMAADVEGFEYEVQSYGTDVPKLKGDHKKYLYGPGSIHTAHSDAEFVTVKDLEESVEGYKKLIRANLKGGGPSSSTTKASSSTTKAGTSSTRPASSTKKTTSTKKTSTKKTSSTKGHPWPPRPTKPGHGHGRN